MSKADVKAGSAFVELFMKDSLTRGLNTAKANLNKFGSDMMALGTKMVAMTAAIGLPIAFATKTFADFDDAMRMVGAVSGSTAAQLQSMTDRAKELGATTSFTALQVALLMTELGRAGFKPDQINVMTDAVMNLARATGTDATLASGIMAASIRQFGLEASDAARVADVLTLAANSTFNTVEGLGESLKYAGPVAKELGMSLEDTVAILGSLGNVGIQGSEAGTALRRLGVITAGTGKELKAIFNIDNVDATGNLKPIVQIMDEIGKAIENLPVAQQIEKMNMAFGLLGITSASVLAGAANDTTALADALRNAGGTADATAKKMDAGLGGAFRIVMSAAEGVAIAIGEALNTSITGVTKSITNVLSVLTEWIGKNQGVVVSFTAVAASIGAAGIAAIALGVAAKIAAVGITAVVSVIGAVKTVVGIAAAAVSLYGTATVLVASLMEAAWMAVAVTSSVASGVAAVAMGGYSAAAAAMGTAWTAVAGVIAAGWAVIMGPATPFIIAAGVMLAAVTAIGVAAAVATVQGMDFSGAWTRAKEVLSDLMAVAKRVGGILMTALGGGDYDIAFRAVMAGIKITFATFIEVMADAWSEFWSSALDLAKAFMMNFGSITLRVVNAISSAMSNPISGALTLKNAMSDLANSSFDIKMALDTEGMKTAANAELDALEKELADRKAKRDAETAAKAKQDAAAGGGEPNASGDPHFSAEDIAILNNIDQDTVSNFSAIGDGADKASEAFDRETEAIQRQIVALREGAEAAEAMRLKQAGLSDEEIAKVQSLQAEQKALEKQNEESQRRIGFIQDFADADAKKGTSSEEVARKEKAAIELKRQQGLISDQAAKEAKAQADIRKVERDHQAALQKFSGEDAGEGGSGTSVKSGKASAATFSAASLIQMGRITNESKQTAAIMATKKAIEAQTIKQKELSDKQIEAYNKNQLMHP